MDNEMQVEGPEPKSLSPDEISKLNKIKSMSVQICDLITELRANPGMDEFLNALNLEPSEGDSE
jgi:hypothetical protein